jgi:TolB-like protein
MQLYQELKRRNVFRVAIAYLAGSWLLIEVAETIFPLFGFDDTPARIMVIVLAIGFPLFLLFSWVFEFTPEGLKKEKDIDRAASVTHKTGKQLDRIIIILLALALGYFAFDKFVLEPARVVDLVEETAQQARSDALVESYGDQSIAVLPFINMSDDAGNEYFSDGISEELINLLAKIPKLRVISRSSAFVFKGEKISIPEVAKKLNVAHILEGSVRKAGNQVRITMQLIEARSDTHLWSETYDRTLDNIFAIQDEIAGTVVAALKLTLLGDAPMAEEIDPQAYTLYLQARHIINTSKSRQSEQAEQKLRQALEIEPAFMPALWELGRNRIGFEGGYSEPSTPQDVTMIRELIERMAAIAPDSSWTNYWRAWDAWKWQGDYQAAAQYFESMIAADPYNPKDSFIPSPIFSWNSDARTTPMHWRNSWLTATRPALIACGISLTKRGWLAATRKLRSGSSGHWNGARRRHRSAGSSASSGWSRASPSGQWAISSRSTMKSWTETELWAA